MKKSVRKALTFNKQAFLRKVVYKKKTIVNYKELWEILGKPDKTSIPNSIDFCEVTGKGCELPNMHVNYEELWNILWNTIDRYEG